MVVSDFAEGMESALDTVKRTKKSPEPEPVPVPVPVPVAAPAPAGGPLSLVTGRGAMQPPRLIVSGGEGIGKSTFASGAPAPIFVQTEDGLGTIDCKRFPLATTYEQFAVYLNSVATDPHPYQTVVIDSLDWLERLIWDHVCSRSGGVKNIEKVGGGFAKGYQFALDEWREVVALLEKCRARGMVSILIAHSKIEKVQDPENGDYDRHSPRLNKHAQALLTEWADAVLFATRRMAVRTEGAGFDQRKIASSIGHDGGDRVLRTMGSPTCLAKSRYGHPAELPMTWNAFVSSISISTKGA